MNISNCWSESPIQEVETANMGFLDLKSIEFFLSHGEEA
ncbi:hypothetical protein AM1_0578 [Acaryochloris marina MBIC11017]|uniref:Uncharacterized protein n=1 Tax=Acaryochloris marina (strain MBIC 11017) TaxID=329726 RepID=B0CD37_ACAM1|nr:hypothetical protein AM1_0578 [Acaryochloris marina MBIC11017]